MDDLPFHKRLLRRRGPSRRAGRTRGVVRRRFTDSLLALAPARRHVRETVADWKLTDDEQDIVVLVANELVSNAVTHARTASRMTLRRSRRVIHVLVRDYSTQPPNATDGDDPTDVTPGCHGLDVVGAASTRWGWHRHRVGKTVWATITVASPYSFA